ncbi:MAG: hypothetical protein V2I63_00355 [Pseudomonadales bacterium]|nr:hypothetical protein [Pseudomonadales bacterium]
MVAVLMSLVLAIFLAGVAWLLVGSRLRLDPDPRQNDILNLGVYVAVAFLPMFAVVYYGLA